MRTILSLFLLVFCSWSAVFAQVQKFEFLGALTSASMAPISLKLSLKIDAQGDVSGTTITDFNGPNHTVSRVQGRYSTEERTLSFAEVENVRTQSDAPSDRFCFIHVEHLKWSENGDERVIRGAFIGQYPNGDTCAEGRIYLVGAAILERVARDTALIQEIQETLAGSDQPITPDQQKTIIRSLNPEQPLRADETVLLPWRSRAVRLQLWDSYEEDHDRLSIFVNDRLVHGAVEAKERKQTFEFPIEEAGELEIRVVADNEGDRPPNTVSLCFFDGNRIHPAVTKLQTGESVTFKVQRND